jgi:hypothetical protein
MPQSRRVSDYFELGRKQPELDFVDIDIRDDLRVFVDPRALRLLPSEWGSRCTSLVQDFFSTVLAAIRDGRHEYAKNLLGVLREPNEVHLGMSTEEARGSGIGPTKAERLWDALSRSEAVRSGLLRDLEDSILLVEGIAEDNVSDIVINVIREPLIEYTQEIAEQLAIPLTEGVTSGPLWRPSDRQWRSEFVRLPVTPFGPLILVPKAIVRIRRMHYNVNEYYRHYLLEELRAVELAANTELVHLLKSGSLRVTKKDLTKKYGSSKADIVRATRDHPQALEEYRRDKDKAETPPPTHEAIAEAEGSAPPDWEALLARLRSVPAGRIGAASFERAITDLLTALCYPALTNPRPQHPIHNGRKILDLTFTNVATAGFFHWLTLHYSAANIVVECKNYVGEVGNPELDQLSGRFSPTRGQIGVLVCRSFDDRERFLERCRDTAKDGRGWIIPMDDSDLANLVSAVQEAEEPLAAFNLLWERFQALNE